MSDAVVHEALIVEGTVKNLDAPIEHYTESYLSSIIQKIDRYSSLGAQEAYKQGKRASVIYAFMRAVVTFVHNYIFRLGVLDAYPGLLLATTDSINKFFKYAKLSELDRPQHLKDAK